MNQKMTPNDLWEDFVKANKEYRDARVPEHFYFCYEKKDADELAMLVKSGVKQATASLLILYEIEKEELPKVGDIYIITDFEGSAVAIIQNTKIEQVPFDKVTEEFAFLEGEGDRSLDYWTRVHRDFFTSELKMYGRDFEEKMVVVCQHFRLLYSL